MINDVNKGTQDAEGRIGSTQLQGERTVGEMSISKRYTEEMMFN